MHIVYIMGQDSGGLPHYTAELANAVADHAEVTVLKPAETTADDVFSDDVSIIEAFEPTDISMQNIFSLNINPYKNAKGLLSYRNIERINELEPDIVHDPTDEFPQVALFSYLADVYEDQPYVVTKHEVEHGGASTILKAADAVISAVPDVPKDVAIVHSEKQQTALRQQEHNIDATEVIPHGVYSFFQEFDYETPPEQENHVLFFGSLIPPKGVEFLVRAVPRIVEKLPDFELTIAGDGELADTSRELVAEYSDHVTLRDDFIPNDEVGTLFERAQLVALPYRSGWQTGHSGTLSTAFAFGKPVVTSAIGDFPELVEETGAGTTVEPENPDALASAVVDILSDDARRASMAASSEALGERLSWENIGDRHLELYERLLDADDGDTEPRAVPTTAP